jgi:hypothetical protein
VTDHSFISEVCTLKSFFPTSSTELGTAPLVIPITENDIFVDGSSIYLTRYNFETGEITNSFSENKTIAPSKSSATGGILFTLADNNYIAYAYNHYNNSTNPSNVQLVSIDKNMAYSSMDRMWTLPQSGLGTISIGTLHVLADFNSISDNKGILYIYSPGNGISAYEITDSNDASITTVTIDDNQHAEYYNLQGININNPSSGIFIKRKGDKVEKIICK